MGLLLSVMLKHLNYSTNPFWCIVDSPSGGWNKTGLLLAIACLMERNSRPVEAFPASLKSEDALKKEDSAGRPFQPISKLQETVVAIGLGGLIHMIQTFLTDAGTVISWTWTGYPVSGPTLHPHAAIVVAVSSLSISFSDSVSPMSIPFNLVGLMSATVLYARQDWVGFLGGLGLVSYLSAMLPHYLRGASACSPARVYGIALLVNIVLDVLSVITTAYAFVPYGHLLRERTDLVLGFSMLAIALGGLMMRGVALPEDHRLPVRARVKSDRVQRWTVVLGFCFSFVASVYGYQKTIEKNPVPYYPDLRMFTGGIWTVSRFLLVKDGS